MIRILAAALVAAALMSSAYAQGNYPNKPESVARFAAVGVFPVANTPEQFA